MNPMPFILRVIVGFYFADSLAKLSVLFFTNSSPFLPVFSNQSTIYYLLLVIAIEFSLAIQIIARAAFCWFWASVFSAVQVLVILSFLCIDKPVEWLFMGTAGRIQIAITIIIYSVLFCYFLIPSVRSYFERLE
ncbi:MAG: hypothetical protein ABIH42_00130 [Planctomycetota bacterium]